jgi:hypothetical protein
MFYPSYIPQAAKKKKGPKLLVPQEWQDAPARPRGVEFKNGIYYLNDATPAKNTVLVASEDVAHLKELCFFLIWRYQKTYTRDYFEQLHGKIFLAFQELLDGKRSSLEGIPGLFSGIVFGDKQYKFKITFFVGHNIPMQMKGADVAIGLSVDRIQNAAGIAMKNPQDLANAYKEIKTIVGQELDYMAKNPAFQKKEEQPAG